MPKWTDEQKLAIEGRGGSLLVSAAAGSGKTTVLVERVIQRLIDVENPCPADRLVIVTFTRAAAANMKERIDKALSKRIAETGDTWLMKQQLLLQSAKICTIDSFCGDIVRENFHLLGISADYTVADKGESQSYREAAVKKVLNDGYESGSEVFRELADTVSSGGNDKAFEEAVMSVHSMLSSYPFPELEIKKLAEPYRGNEQVSDTIWGRVILDEVKLRLRYCIGLMQECVKILSEPDEAVQAVSAEVSPMVADDLYIYSSVFNMAEDNDWDGVYKVLRQTRFLDFTRKRNLDPQIKESIKSRRKFAKEIFEKMVKLVCVSSDEFESDRKKLLPLVECFADCVEKYSRELAAIKMRSNKFDFGDIEHFALDLLVERDGESFKKTALAQTLSQTYVEIMVDEYQDTNMLQDMIFSAISADESNMFFVGDVKQSIYRFRQAMPEIFLGRRDSLPMFDGENYPSRVNLSSNFRSRNGVTSAVNFVFSRLMSKQLGEITYNDDEQLNPMASYPDKVSPDVELRVRKPIDEESEYVHVAHYIKNLLASGKTVSDSGAERPIRAGDICVLVRTKKHMGDFARAIEELGIPADCVVEGSIGGTAEVRIILSLLRVLDNPLQDIQLTAVMMSPLFGFTPGELAKIRTGARKGTPVYRSVVSAAAAGDDKCRSFLDKIDEIRKISIGMGAAEFMRRLFDETDILSLAGALEEPEQRTANLMSLLDFAVSFDATGACGLSAFLRFLETAEHNNTEFYASENSHAVKVMTVHKSKGLEFPVCILAELSYKIKHPERSNVIFNRSFGLGMLLREPVSGKSLFTLPYVACDLSSTLSELSEETRVLYVAMTRAKEQLVLIATCNYEKILKSVEYAFDRCKKLDYTYSVSVSSYADWLVPIFACHIDSCDLRMLGEANISDLVVDPGFTVDSKVISTPCEAEDATDEICCEEPEYEPDAELLSRIKERVDYVYPYESLSNAVAKKQASGFLDETFDEEFFASSRPAFMNSGGLTAAQKGTLTHKFLQLCNFDNSSIDDQVAAMISSGKLTSAEADELKLDEIQAFYSSEICSRIRNSELVMREKKFAMLMPVREVYPELPEIVADENLVVQGMLDLCFVEDGQLVIVDYKTDRGVGEDEIRERHYEQLYVYAKAMEKCTDYSVKAAYIYSLSLKKEIKVL